MPSEYKACPFCGEQIRREAVKCRFCGEWLELRNSPTPITHSIPVTSADAPSQTSAGGELNDPVRPTPPPAASAPSSRVVLIPQRERIGGWLLLLVINFVLTPLAAINRIIEMKDSIGSFADKLPTMPGLGVAIYCWMHWAIAAVSAYCAYVLAWHKPGAASLARRGLLLMVFLAWGSGISIVGLVLGPVGTPAEQIGQFLGGECIPVTIWCAIWYAYLGRSRRVRETFLTGRAPDREISYELLDEAGKLETEGRTREAILAYESITKKFPNTPAGRDARKRLETLQGIIFY